MTKLFNLAVFGAVVAVYTNWSPPPLSASLVKWRGGGSYFTYRGHSIFYRDEAGSESYDDTLLCLHGFPTSSYDWIKILPDLKARFRRIIMPDFLGLGFSDKPTNNFYSLQQQADIVEKLLESLHLTSVHLLGHDYGDTVAEELVYRFNKRAASEEGAKLFINSLLMLNGGMFPETNFPTPLQKILVIPYIGDIVTRLTCFQLFKYGFGRVFGPYTPPNYEEMMEFWMVNTVNEGHKVTNKLLVYMAERWKHKERWVGALQRTSVPIHTVFGTADVVNPPDPFIGFYRKTLPNAGLTVLPQKIGHYPQWEAPSEVIRHYFAFLDQLGNEGP